MINNRFNVVYHLLCVVKKLFYKLKNIKMGKNIDTEKFNLIQSIRITFADIRQSYLEKHRTNTIDNPFIKETFDIQEKQENWVSQWYDRNSK